MLQTIEETLAPLQSSKSITSDSLEAQVGNTPLLRLDRIERAAGLSPAVELYAKAEWFNPSGSVKDRPALNIIQEALASGKLNDDRRLLDSTSGNMGISYATLGKALGVQVTLAIPANASRERITILRALGAELVLTDPLEGTDGAIEMARRMAAENPTKYYYWWFGGCYSAFIRLDSNYQ